MQSFFTLPYTPLCHVFLGSPLCLNPSQHRRTQLIISRQTNTQLLLDSQYWLHWNPNMNYSNRHVVNQI